MRQEKVISHDALEPDQVKQIDALAQQLARPAHELVRDAIRLYIEQVSVASKSAMVRSGPTDTASDQSVFGSWEGVDGVAYENEARQK